MNINKIKEVILDKNGKMKHKALNKNWYIKNKTLEIYNSIFIYTNFLDNNAGLRERIFYIENDILVPKTCTFCKKQVRLLNSKKFCSTCKSAVCEYKRKKTSMLKIWNSRTEIEKKNISNKISKKLSGRKLTPEQCKACSNRMKGKKQSKELVKKRIEGRKNNGKPWFTEEIKKKLSESNKITHSSKEFREKYKEVYENSRMKQSRTMKKKIAEGSFTPPITNSWTRWKAYAKKDNVEKKFRSSWEAVFWLMNENVEFEKIRIPYVYENNEKIYIVDFVSYEKKELYEIKPKSTRDTKKNKNKFSAAENWCKEKNFTFIIVDDDWFIKNVSSELLSGNEHLLEPMRQFL